MSKRPKALIEAQERYEKKRAKRPVGFRMTPADLKRLDDARGDDSRAKYVEKAVLDRLDGEE